MFRRFHDTGKSKKKQQQVEETVTYAQIAKTNNHKKAQNYSNKHQKTKHDTSTLDPNTPLTVECFKTDHFLFQGVVRGTIKSGEGIMIMRNGMMIIGNWSNDFLEGRALVFTAFGGKILANFIRGKLNGWMISFYRTNIIRCTLYYENQIEGQRLTYDDKERMWVSSRCTQDGKVISILHAEKGIKGELPTFVRSEELRDMFSRFVVNRENFLGTQMLEQFEISLTTSYVGFVDEEKRPCGLGCAYSDHELYCGNFFEGVLEHYGRMLFQNGDIYQGELMSGTFWGRGMYYSPHDNQTSILATDYQEQAVEGEFKGYVLIDIVPTIGQPLEASETGFKGTALKKATQNLQPYYLKDYANFKKSNNKTKSNMSQCGHSQELQLEFKDGKECELKKPHKHEKQESESPYFSPKNNQNRKNDKWIKFNQSQLQQIGLKRAITGKDSNKDRKISSDTSSIDRKQARQEHKIQAKKEQLEGRSRISPSHKVMTQIYFPKQNTYELKDESPKTRFLSSGVGVDKKKSKQNDWIDPVDQKDELAALPDDSVDSRKLAAMLETNRTHRKKIFY